MDVRLGTASLWELPVKDFLAIVPEGLRRQSQSKISGCGVKHSSDSYIDKTKVMFRLNIMFDLYVNIWADWI